MKKYYWGIGAALLCIFGGTGCTRPVREAPASGFASVRNEILVDSLGRELVLNGINHVTKSPEDRYVYPNDEQLFKEFRNLGNQLHPLWHQLGRSGTGTGTIQ